MQSKKFECDNCGNSGKISVRESDYVTLEIAYCPLCGADISSPDDENSDEDEE